MNNYYNYLIIALKVLSIGLPIGIILHITGYHIEYDKQIHYGFAGGIAKIFLLVGNTLLIISALIIFGSIIGLFYYYLWVVA